MNSLLNNLIISIKSNNEEKIKENLKAIITQGTNIELNDSVVIEYLFPQTNIEILTLTANAIAELSKAETNRQILSTKEIISFLIDLFKRNVDTLTEQACRGLGNICFENSKARELVGNDGVKTIFVALEKVGENPDLQTKACGLLLNLLMDNDDLQKTSLDLHILKLIEDILKQKLSDFDKNEDCCLHLLMILNMLTENMGDTWLSTSLCALFVDILKISQNSEISVTCLEIIHGQLENDEIKVFFARKGVCELIFQLVEKYNSKVDDEESRAVLKMACDVIVLILTGDESMTVLYDNGKGVTYKNMLLWLKSADCDLLSTSILAIGNFARNDAHCTQMVQSGLAKTLLDLLSKHNLPEKDPKLQYVILSAIRNLVILPQNKIPILREGLLDVLYPMLKSCHSHVVFKLLGTLRIVIDGQEKEAFSLIMRKDLLEKIVVWCFDSDHIGVRGEASRLLAWLIKHCHSSKPFPIVLEGKDCVKCLVEMLSSNYAVMQNEAIFALSLLCVECLGDKSQLLDKLLVEADIGKHLNFLITKYKDNLSDEIVVNILSFLESLMKSVIVREHLKASELGEAILKLSETHKYVNFQNKLLELSNKLQQIKF